MCPGWATGYTVFPTEPGKSCVAQALADYLHVSRSHQLQDGGVDVPQVVQVDLGVARPVVARWPANRILPRPGRGPGPAARARARARGTLVMSRRP